MDDVQVPEIRVSFTYGSNPCIRIQNSYLVTSKDGILEILEGIHRTPKYEKLKEYGYTRTLQSEYREWRGHNFLYRLGICRARTGSVDIDQNEPKIKRIIYAILSIFERK